MRRWIRAPALATLFALTLGGEAPATAGPAAVVAAAPSGAETKVELPKKSGSLKFVVLGDFGTGGRGQYELAARMAKFHQEFEFGLVVTVGDNIYGGQGPRDVERKFEIPYKPLLDAGVKFYAALGNHDSREERYYKLFNMDGKLYYTFRAPNEKVRFFMLDSGYPVPEQLAWLERELKGSGDEWRIAVFHHPLYSSGGRHGSSLKLRETLEPLFERYDVSVVLTGHDHFYERIEPQHGIAHFVVGSGGQLAKGDIRDGTGLTAKGFDTENVFLAVEISGDELFFNAISNRGQVVDSGRIERRLPAPSAP